MRILVTGAQGFIGRHLCEALRQRDADELYAYDLGMPLEQLERWCHNCDFVFHLADARNSHAQEDYMAVHYGFTETLLKLLARGRNACPVMFASSEQAAHRSLYGHSKKAGEDIVLQYARETGAEVYIFRLPDVFGKWAEPNQRCPVATLCYYIARGKPAPFHDTNAVLRLAHIDDVIRALMGLLEPETVCQRAGDFCVVPEIYSIDGGALQTILEGFYRLRENGGAPQLGDPLARRLYATYQSYLPIMDLSYPLDMREDGYGSATRFISSPDYGQISVNVIRPGIAEGEHWHNARSEKHLIVTGEGLICFRKPGDAERVEYRVSGKQHTVVEIPAGYMHAVTNVGKTDLIDVVWSSVCWDPQDQDTFA